MPFFSIILPAYNRAHKLKPTLESIMNQSFTDWELILVDDGSTDDTKTLVESFSDERIKYYWIENGERGAARNYGASKASGKFLNFFDSDDRMKTEHLQMAFDYLSKETDAKVLCFPWDYYDSKGNKLGERRHFDQDLNQRILKHNCIHLDGGFINAEFFQKNKFQDDREFHICEDWYFYMQASLNTKIHGVNTPSFDYVIHEESTMSNMSSAAFIVALRYFDALIEKSEIVRKHKRYIHSDMYGMLGLAYALEGKKGKALKYLMKVAGSRFAALFQKRTLGILKNVIYAKRRG